jgi:hypothetical protein
MRALLISLVLVSLLLSGCESMPAGVRDRFSPVSPKARTFEGDLRTVCTAAQHAFKQLDCVLTDASGAPSRLEASSRIQTTESLGDSRQLVISLHLREVEKGRTVVEMLISLQVENASLGGPSAQDMREHGFYDIFFTTLQQLLQERAGDGPRE